ncbi:hypothetical protein EJB05_29725 [Eragrostis curvula]|uniref:Uncharacterized protein n=1 Tax=Eragrostis curvula TaxID=38414 RepID=A0A5J9UTG9_9POAL|nr:hypothetical protein EJB05_29725 [Eragrostis curvula]
MSTAKRHLGDAVSPPPKLVKPDDDTEEPPAKPVCVVAAVSSKQPQLAYSAFLVDADAVAKPPHARNLVRLAGSEDGMSFVAAHSRHGSWIVGVGGPRGGAIIYDPSTEETLRAPGLSYPKLEPILISHRGKVYALSRRPRVRCDWESDFVPWFESLNFNKVVPCVHHKGCPPWKSLPSPPFFPLLLRPSQFRNPPNISVSSYAAVGSYILLSLEQKACTYAFHVEKKTWEKVFENNMPFVGQAVPLGDNLFACREVLSDGAASVVLMSISISSTPEILGELTTRSLSIQKFPLASGEDPWPLVYPLGKGSFCSINWVASSPQGDEAGSLKDPQIMLTTFQIDNMEDILTACQTEDQNLNVTVHVGQQKQTYELKGQPQFPDSHMPLVVSLDREHIELLKSETTETRKMEPATSNVFKVRVTGTIM